MDHKRHFTQSDPLPQPRQTLRASADLKADFQGQNGAEPVRATTDAKIATASGGYVLNNATLALLDTLPPTLRLIDLRRHFPHVLLRLAAAWSDPLAMLHEFRSLKESDRPTRGGFPSTVEAEITLLADYYYRTVHPNLDALYRGDR